MKRAGIFERTMRESLRVCLAGRPVQPELLAPVEAAPPLKPAPDGTNIQIDFHRPGDDDASF